MSCPGLDSATAYVQPHILERIIQPAIAYPSRHLDAKKHEIRVLCLQPGQLEDEVRCTLDIISLDAPRNRNPLQAICSDEPFTLRRKFETRNPRDWILAAPRTLKVIRDRYRHQPLGAKSLPGKIRAAYMAHRLSQSQDFAEQHLLRFKCCYDQTACQCYEALSYTWGSTENGRRKIKLNGETDYYVAANLFLALRRLRRPATERRLWIDALCVNQGDLVERASQVRMMSKVYSCSNRVLVWLGDANEPKHLWRRHYPYHSNGDEISSLRDWHMRTLGAALLQTVPCWWERTWVVQEFYHAPDAPDVCFGELEVSWHYFGKCITTMCANLPSKKVANPALEVLVGSLIKAKQYTFAALRDSTLDKEAPHAKLVVMAMLTRYTSATDPRDKVYSLLSMIDVNEASLIEPNYKPDVSPWHVFIEATLSNVINSGALNALNLIVPRQMGDVPLPSWAVDFSSRTNGRPFEHYPSSIISTRSLLWTTPEADSRAKIWASQRRRLFSDKKDELYVSGSILDHIKIVHLRRKSTLVVDEASLSRMRRELKLLLTRRNPYAMLARCQCASRYLWKVAGHGNTLDAMSLCSIPSTASIPPLSDYPLGTDDWMLAGILRWYPPSNDSLESGDEWMLAGIFLWWLAFVARSPSASLDIHVLDQYDLIEAITEREIAPWRAYQGVVSADNEETFFITDAGFIGLGLADVRPDDLIVRLRGSARLAVLRPARSNGDEFLFQGWAMVSGLMYDELSRLCRDFDAEEQEFTLI